MAILAVGLAENTLDELRAFIGAAERLDLADGEEEAMECVRQSYLDETPCRLVIVKMRNDGFTGLTVLEAIRKFELNGAHNIPVVCLVEDAAEVSMLGLFSRPAEVFLDMATPMDEILTHAEMVAAE